MFFWKRKKQQEATDQEVSGGQRYNLIREEENRRYLKELLSRKRPQALQERLLKVLAHEKDILKKIRIVERVDLRGGEVLLAYEERLILFEQGANAKKAPIQESQYQFEQPSRGHSGGKSSHFPVSRKKQPRRRGDYFRFLFSDFRRISEFGRFHLLLRGRLYRGRHELTDDFLRFWNVELKVLLSFLEEPLATLLQCGWHELTPLQYNLAVRLARLAGIYRSERLLILEKRVTREVFRHAEVLAGAWLPLFGRPDYRELLLDGLQSFLQTRKEYRPVIRRILMAADTLLSLRKNGPCLKNALLSLYMASQKRFIEFDEFRGLYTIDPVPNDFWDAPAAVLEQIRSFIEAREEEVSQLEKNLFFLSEMRISGYEQMEEAVLKNLWDLYNGRRASPGESGRSPVQSARQLLGYDLISFFERVVQNYIHAAQPLLMPPDGLPESLGGVGFERECAALQKLAESIRSLRGSHERMTIPLTFYRQFFNERDLPGNYSETERSYCLYLRSIAENAYRLAVKANHVLSQARALPEATPLPVDPDEGGWFAGKGGVAVFGEIINGAIGIALILEEASLMALIRRQSAMESRHEELMILLKRMAPHR